MAMSMTGRVRVRLLLQSYSRLPLAMLFRTQRCDRMQPESRGGTYV
jgi:hypothetical protein